MPQEIQNQDWRPVSVPASIAVYVSIVIVLYLANTDDHWVFLLDNANLAFHEFGHPFFGFFSERLMVYGGTLGQLIFPVVTVIVFWKRRETVACAICWIWLFENFFNIARYMADARAMALPLVGGLDPEDYHDWREIFSRWGALNADTKIAGFTKFIAWTGMIAVSLWLLRITRRSKNTEATE